ncbi:ABC transporter substrate-binding protein [Rhodococcus sp. X156]|uniref:heme/hemin ABC transporter substrate-binding protein n=1 Tax=Rhodococcus sp. X156 TaxID=2499145 RepID=UPI001F498A83|nr:ABC transporter substrate-binding protein [Rhodococcus sp. X156]
MLLTGAVLAGCSAAGDTASSSSAPVTATLAQESPRIVATTAAPTLPVTVASADGSPVTVTSADRIVAVDRNGTLGQTVFALGLGERLVGRDLATDFPEVHDLPVITPGGHQLNAEAVLGLRPTVVLTDGSIGPRSAVQQLRDAGIPVVTFPGDRTVAGVGGLVAAVGTALGVPDQGRQLAEHAATAITDATAQARQRATGERVAFLYLRGTSVAMMGGKGSGADELIAAIGEVDAGVDSGLGTAYTPITPEALIVAKPDVLLLMTHGLESVGGIDGLLQVPGIAQTPAGQNRRVVVMDDTDLLSFGADTGDVIRALGEAVHRSAGQ